MKPTITPTMTNKPLNPDNAAPLTMWSVRRDLRGHAHPG
ncbi:hypothetical protein HNR07_004915 [Nocardiopsis metallicus]|uniref:Uncharacterized protein n=1 Tax=Nocardiopsis metallicus TaxID=179819 RepID=A0A840WUF2_9ACTN|nr:hypothetical protein [Nocardiopsis metallicus]